jgi:hypothetical protein
MAGIVPDNSLHFLHPWRSDGVYAARVQGRDCSRQFPAFPPSLEVRCT